MDNLEIGFPIMKMHYILKLSTPCQVKICESSSLKRIAFLFLTSQDFRNETPSYTFTPLEMMPRSASSPAIAGLEFLTG